MKIVFSSTVLAQSLVEILNLLNSEENFQEVEKIIDREEMFRLQKLKYVASKNNENEYISDVMVEIEIVGDDSRAMDDCLKYYRLAKKLMDLLSGWYPGFRRKL
jgi:hypothetical protein